MSKVIDVSPKLGEYMLKGWILTDRTCPTSNCNIPLMRSPKHIVPTVHYCANCDTDPYTRSHSPGPAGAVSATHTSPAASSSALSRPSTPPTEVSSGLSSPTFAPPPESAESIRRRQQSDEASAEIGRKMLQGYAMLADECPDPSCFGVPLVRPPKSGTEKDPRKECVVCRKTFINESDAMQWEQSHQTTVIRGQLSSAPTLNVPNPSVSTITDLTGDGSRSQDRPRARTAQAPSQSAARIPVVTAAPTLQSHQATTSSSQASSRPLPDETVGASIDALKQALDALRTCLVQETASVSTMDVAAVGTIAESMGRTAQALVHVEQLRKRT